MGYAINHELVGIAKILLDPPRGARSDVNARAFRDVLETQNTQLIDAFLQSKQRKKYLGRLLRASIANGDDKYFEYAMKLVADPNACEGYDTPLSLCAKYNRPSFAETLIAKGAEVNSFHGSPDLNRGSTPLVTAADHGHTKMVGLLLKHGAKVNRQVAGNRSALQGACRSGHTEIVKRLLNEGADVHYRTVTGATSLHWAIEPSHWSKHVRETTKAEIVQLLLRAWDRSAD